jgi:hypothetical protein
MDRKHDVIFARLMKPFSGDDVRTKPQGGRQLKYITARHVMNRLDDVLGPDNWWDDYSPTAHGVICRLTIRLPGGQELTKVDAGGNPEMKDEGDSDKGGFSDAFKRAAVKFGVGRHLYDDGIPRFADRIIREHSERQEQPQPRQEAPPPRRAEAPADQQRLGHPHAQPRGDKPGIDLFKWAKDNDQLKPMTDWAKSQGIAGLMKDWTQEQCDLAWQQFGGVKA